MRHYLFIPLLFISIISFSTTHSVGIDKDYPSPNALYVANVVTDGDTILIDPMEYIGTACLAVWQQNNLVFIGGGDGINKATLIADGEYIWGKGIWVIGGENTEVHNIEFYGAQVPDKNGAGIRLDGGSIFINDCNFFYNEMGILSNSSPGTVRVEHCTFAYNGFGDGFSHNIYINNMDFLIFRYNESHHSVIGHTLKSRARHNIIEYNLFYDGDDGNSSRLIDLPNGGFSLVMGNILIQGPNAENNNIVGYGLEGLYNSMVNSLYFINNTVINEKTTSGRFLHIKEGSENIIVANNIFAGIGEMIDGESTEEYSNIINENIDYFQFIVNQDGRIYSVEPSSPVINAGTSMAPLNDFSLIPVHQFHLSEGFTERSILEGTIEVGAYEVAGPVSVKNSEDLLFYIYPNPINDVLQIKSPFPIRSVKILSNDGKLLYTAQYNKFINLADITSGIYLLEVEDYFGITNIKSFIKH